MGRLRTCESFYFQLDNATVINRNRELRSPPWLVQTCLSSLPVRTGPSSNLIEPSL